MRTIKWLTTIALALAPGLASANPYRYQEQNKLAEVSADPRDGGDRIQLPPGQFSYLELRARDAPVMLRDFIVRFADGRVIHTGSRGTIIPGQGRVVYLPQTSAPIVDVIADYGPPQYRRFDRTPARLEIFGVPQHCNDERISFWGGPQRVY